MAVETLKIIAQTNPSAAANTTLYTVPEKTQVVISSITICNTTGSGITARVYVVPYGGSASVSNALYYDLAIPTHDTFIATVGLTLGDSDFIVIYSSATNVSFQLFGTTITPK